MSVRIALTCGEPAGIGPDLVATLAQQEWPAELVVITDRNLLKARAEKLGLALTLHDFAANEPAQCRPAGHLSVIHCPLPQTKTPPFTVGQLNVSNAPWVIDTLHRASQGALDSTFAAIATGPVHKGIINDADIPFQGHTEYFAAEAGCTDVVMMLATEGLRVALVTTHLPLADVPAAITPQRLRRVISILHHDLQTKFAVTEPRILVCGLNPHAGENGHLGSEEIRTINPLLEELRSQHGWLLQGPLPADTIFQPYYLEHADAVLAMYHDQGLPVLKFKGFGAAVNITLGLPYIRTSVDHGTALDLAGSGKANSGSFILAVKQAISMASKTL